MTKLSPEENALVAKYIYDKCGINLLGKAFLVESKIAVECFLLKIATFAEYWQRLNGTGSEAQRLQQRLLDALTTSYTYFYREETHFDYLTKLLSEKQLPIHKTALRGWCAGCANGQEAYSLAMALEAATTLGQLNVPYSIVGSDISQKAIKAARLAQYSMSDYVRLPEAWRKAYCFLLPNGCEIRRQLREKVEFRQENLVAPAALLRHYDFIFCRNVLIYFDEASTKRLINTLRQCLAPGGYLFLGHTEIFQKLPGFELVTTAVYKKVSENDI